MVRVTILNHDEHVHRASGVHFKPRIVDGAWLGTADVDEATAAEHFKLRPELFRVEVLPADVAPSSATEQTSPPSSPEPTPDAHGAPQGGASEGGAPAATVTAHEGPDTAPEAKVVPDFASKPYPELLELAKLADLGLAGNASKAALVAALSAHAAK
jgi:hypothetical protein